MEYKPVEHTGKSIPTVIRAQKKIKRGNEGRYNGERRVEEKRKRGRGEKKGDDRLIL